ncbi:MAG TPA: hypothetical protein VE129_00745 [Thermoanaerobaculia bacterium]|nr:hypothetical protein [Thermoanaerobaculia bacterium]
MIRLRPEQLEAFREEARATLADRLVRRGEERFPEKTPGRTPVELRAEAHRLAAVARERGFVSEEEVTLFYDLSLELGPGFEQGPAGAWAREILKERGRSPRERLEKLAARVLGVEEWDPHRERARKAITGRVTRVVGKGPPRRLDALKARQTELNAIAARLRAGDSKESPLGDPARKSLRTRVDRVRRRLETEQALRLELEHTDVRGREKARALRSETEPGKRKSLEQELDRLSRRFARTLEVLEVRLAEDAPRRGSADAEDPCVARIPTDRVSEREAVRAEAARRLRVARDLCVAGGSATEGDRIVVAIELSRMPGEALAVVRRAGTKVVACRGSVTDYRPDLAGGRPRGWPPGSSWGDVPGLYDGPRNEVVVATRGHAPQRAGRVPAKGEGHASASLAVHVVCHAADACGGSPSSSAEFRAARSADRDALPEYCRQPGSAGPEESWAESAALRAADAAAMAAALPRLHAYWAAREVGPGAAGAEARAAAEAEVRTTRIWRRSSIGTATLDANDAIALDLRASDGRGILGDARVVCPKGDPRYADLLAHLGGLAADETKPVPPWPVQR